MNKNIIEGIKQLTTLTDLAITDCSIDDMDLISIAKLINLQFLDLQANDHLTAAGLSYLTSLTNLQRLDLRNCRQLTGNNTFILGINTIYM